MSVKPKNSNQLTRADIVNSDSDPYIAVGTPIFEDPEDDDEARREPTYGYRVKKNKEGDPPDQYLPTWKQVVTDEEGRRRFHGAFTGGFSAGYYNTVGSKEGWAPSMYKSSRGKKSQTPKKQSITDYMDEEDLEDFGMNKNLKVKQKYETFSSQSTPNEQKPNNQEYSNFGDLFSGGFAPTATETQAKEKKVQGPSRPPSSSSISQQQKETQEQIIPANESIGVRLLQRMGWKHGEGIGAKIPKKVYGVALPPGEKENDSDTTNSRPEIYAAPKDAPLQYVNSKSDVYGLGYDPHENAPEFRDYQIKSIGENDQAKSMKMGDVLHGGSSATDKYGLGAFEDQDDFDIYQSDDRSLYSSYLQDPSKSWQSSSKKATRSDSSSSSFSAFSSIRKSSHDKGRVPVPGFVLGERRTEPIHRWFAAPEVPRSFNPMHRFSKREEMLPTESAIHKVGKAAVHSSAEERRKMLGERSLPGRKEAEAKRDRLMKEKDQVMNESIYSLFKPEDRARILEKAEQSRRLIAEKRRQAEEKEQQQERERQSSASTTSSSSEMKAPSKTPPKHELFPHMSISDRFVSSRSTSSEKVSSEKKEDQSSSTKSVLKPGLYYPKPQSSESQDQQTEVSKSKEESKYKPDKESENYDYYAIETEEYEWHPASLLCKRFEVPNPYPNESKIGTVRKEKEKRSQPSSSIILDQRQSQSLMPTAAEMHHRSQQATGSATNEYSNSQESFARKGSKKPQKTQDEKVMEELGLNAKEVFREDEEEEEHEKSKEINETKIGKPKEEEETEKPPVNLFKAIFENDESEEEEDDDDDKDEIDKNEISEQSVESQNKTQDSSAIDSSMNSIGDKKTSQQSSALYSQFSSQYENENRPLLNEDAFQPVSKSSFADDQRYNEDPILREYQQKQNREKIQKEEKKKLEEEKEEEKQRYKDKKKRKKKKKRKHKEKVTDPQEVQRLENRITQLKSLLSNAGSSDSDLSSLSDDNPSSDDIDDKKRRQKRKKKHRHKRKHKKDKKESKRKKHEHKSSKSHSSDKSRERKRSHESSPPKISDSQSSSLSSPPNKRRRISGI